MRVTCAAARRRGAERASRRGAARAHPLALSRRVGCIALRRQTGDAGAAQLVAALATDAAAHTGGAIYALTLRDGEAHAACARLADLDVEQDRCGRRRGYARAARSSVAPPLLRSADGAARPRSCPNDGKCDAHGRLWVGTKARAPQRAYVRDRDTGALAPDPAAPPPPGRLFCVAEGGVGGAPFVRRADAPGPLTVSNGIGFSPDGATLYHVDSPARCVHAYDFDVAAGALANRRVLFDLASLPDVPPGAVPDGLAVDAAGALWLALWDGGCVLRIGADGALLLRVPFPVSRPTCLAFGFGTTLYVTSCSRDAGDDAPLPEPLAGAVFALDAGVQGVPLARCAF
jgi:sugar lactone lactonase YvrE